MRIAIVVLSLAALLACGRKDENVEAQKTTGRYTVGDLVRYKVERVNYGNPSSYVEEGRVTGVSGSQASIEWRDLYENDFSLIDWKEGENPLVSTINYNAPAEASKASACTYEDDSSLSLTVPAGAFDCNSYDYTCKQGDQAIHYTGCESPQVAITERVAYTKAFLDADGNVSKSYTRTLLETHKN